MLVSDRIVEIELGDQIVRVNKTQALPIITGTQACVSSSSSRDDAKIALPNVKFKEVQLRSPDGFSLPKELIRSDVNEDKTDESKVRAY